MISLEIKNFSQEEWQQIISRFNDISLSQTWEYMEAKAKTTSWKTIRGIFTSNGSIVGSFQGTLRTIPGMNRGLVWIYGAPMCQSGPHELNRDQLREIYQQLYEYWVNKRKMYLRISPPLEDENSNYELLKNLNYRVCYPSRKWMTEVIDLHKSENEVRANLDQKWRNCLNKSEKLGLQCLLGATDELLNEFLSDYDLILKKKQFYTSNTPELITNMQKLLPEERKMIVFAARKGTQKLGSILIAKYGCKSIYFGGAVNEDGKKLNANYFLLWRAINEMRERGCSLFDLGGVSPKETPKGILHFKQGLKGRQSALVGEFEAYRGLIALLIKSITERAIRKMA